MIERDVGGGVEFALTDGSGRGDLVANAQRLLQAWQQAVGQGITVQVNDLGHAWYTAGGRRRFLAPAVPGLDAQGLSDYVRSVASALDAQPASPILAGRLEWPQPPR